jgi:hypothetical protein
VKRQTRIVFSRAELLRLLIAAAKVPETVPLAVKTPDIRVYYDGDFTSLDNTGLDAEVLELVFTEEEA